ncbi:uncharacterized protein SOCG_02388 [Schizosaccharomyces octosporus yFS286]|uniref:Uncharacterized protein n=1 Tax=Schizosaccharomyces octosporus (strain yFS286) TaxID=483514 RepID=S9Q5I3_SCHOY|nr:uncharacterized protein SOCG_02388 [Schizosaccharomyces octosporus yFS286]EPX74908.1 hypothetical protein SOCG_02388 [Schizosaccharomyces octosporus yFS286]
MKAKCRKLWTRNKCQCHAMPYRTVPSASTIVECEVVKRKTNTKLYEKTM